MSSVTRVLGRINSVEEARNAQDCIPKCTRFYDTMPNRLDLLLFALVDHWTSARCTLIWYDAREMRASSRLLPQLIWVLRDPSGPAGCDVNGKAVQGGILHNYPYATGEQDQ